MTPDMVSKPIVNDVTIDKADSIAQKEIVEDVDEERGERKCGSMNHADETDTHCQRPEGADAQDRQEPNADEENVANATKPANNPVTIAGAKELAEKSSTDAERPKGDGVVIAKESTIDPDEVADSKESTDAEGPTYKPEADVKEPVDESAGNTEEEEAKGEFDTYGCGRDLHRRE